MGISIRGVAIPQELAEEIFLHSCVAGSNPQKLSLVCKSFAQAIRSNTFWKRLWEYYAASASTRLCSTIQQQIHPDICFREVMLIFCKCTKDRNVLSEGFWSMSNDIDVKVMPSLCALLPAFPEDASSLTITQNPHLQFLPTMPAQLTYVVVKDGALRMLPPLSHLVFLKTLIISHAQLKKMHLKDLPCLEIAQFNRNQIAVFSVENCPQLQEIDLEDNQLTAVPSSLAHIPVLVELKLAGNPIKKKPKWLKKIKAVYFSRNYDMSQSCLWNFLKKISRR